MAKIFKQMKIDFLYITGSIVVGFFIVVLILIMIPVGLGQVAFKIAKWVEKIVETFLNFIDRKTK